MLHVEYLSGVVTVVCTSGTTFRRLCPTCGCLRLVAVAHALLAALFIMRVYAIYGGMRLVAIICTLPVLGRVGIDFWVSTKYLSAHAQVALIGFLQ